MPRVGRRKHVPEAARRGAAPAGKRGLRIVVTAGPTRERIDPVRFLTNDSSGRMGFAIAEEAARRGHAVTLIAGPVSLPTPRGVERIDIESARELLDVLRPAFRACDALVMAAAVADWRPAKRLASKWRAKDSGAEATALPLVRNPDVLATATGGKRVPGKVVVAFALETGPGASGETRARRKLAKKGADLIVLNGPSSLGGERTSATLLGADGSRRVWRERTKRAVAAQLVREIELRSRR